MHAAARQHGVPDTGAPVPGRFTAALIAAEDAGFYGEPGIDPAGVTRATAGTLAGTPGDYGGATLEQQLAKLLCTPRLTRLGRQADRRRRRGETGRRLPEMADFGDVCRHRVLRPRHYGLTAAACGYFRTSPADLDWARASLLAGIVQAPSADDPFQDPAAAAARQRYMLARLTAAGTLTTARAAAISGSPLGLRPAGTAARCR